jgi:hypothetical protein
LAQGANATNPRYCQPIINKQDNIFQYSSLVASSEVYLNTILILESGKARNKAFSRRLFGVLACQNRSLISPPETHPHFGKHFAHIFLKLTGAESERTLVDGFRSSRNESNPPLSSPSNMQEHLIRGGKTLRFSGPERVASCKIAKAKQT